MLMVVIEKGVCFREQRVVTETYIDTDPEVTYRIVSYLTKKGKQEACRNKPLFLTIANVGSRLYWKLIENFFYTMGKFGHGDCAVLVCISGGHGVVWCGVVWCGVVCI
jgi:hypothetical protein